MTDIDTVWLAAGRHPTRDEGVNLLEAVAWHSGKSHRDVSCPAPLAAIAAYANDALDDDARQELRKHIDQIADARGEEGPMAWLALDWLVHTQAPAGLRSTGMVAEAEALEALGDLNAENWRGHYDTLLAAGEAAMTRAHQDMLAGQVGNLTARRVAMACCHAPAEGSDPTWAEPWAVIWALLAAAAAMTPPVPVSDLIDRMVK